MEVVVAVAALAAVLVFALESWTRQQHLKLMRASNTRLLKR